MFIAREPGVILKPTRTKFTGTRTTLTGKQVANRRGPSKKVPTKFGELPPISAPFANKLVQAPAQSLISGIASPVEADLIGRIQRQEFEVLAKENLKMLNALHKENFRKGTVEEATATFKPITKSEAMKLAGRLWPGWWKDPKNDWIRASWGIVVPYERTSDGMIKQNPDGTPMLRTGKGGRAIPIRAKLSTRYLAGLDFDRNKPQERTFYNTKTKQLVRATPVLADLSRANPHVIGGRLETPRTGYRPKDVTSGSKRDFMELSPEAMELMELTRKRAVKRAKGPSGEPMPRGLSRYMELVRAGTIQWGDKMPENLRQRQPVIRRPRSRVTVAPLPPRSPPISQEQFESVFEGPEGAGEEELIPIETQVPTFEVGPTVREIETAAQSALARLRPTKTKKRSGAPGAIVKAKGGRRR